MIKAPPPTLRISVSEKEHEVRFVDPVSATDYRLWDITYNSDGRITSASDEQHSFGEPVVTHPAEPVPVKTPEPPSPLPKPMPHR